MLTQAEKGTVFQQLHLLLDKECKLYEHYLKVIHEERQSITKVNLPIMKERTATRETLLGEMGKAQKIREQLLLAMGEPPQAPLSEVIKRQFSKESAVLLIKKIELLKRLIRSAQKDSNELNGIISFAQRLVSGCMGIISSATQHVFKSYSPFGKLKEAYHPSNSKIGTRRV